MRAWSGRARRRLMAKGWAIKGAAASWWLIGQFVMGAAYLSLLPDLLLNVAWAWSGGSGVAKSVYEGTALAGSPPHVAGMWIKALLAEAQGGGAGAMSAALALMPLFALFGVSGMLSAKAKSQANALWGKGEREHQKMRDGERRALAEQEELERELPEAKEGGQREPKGGRGWL